MKWMILLMAVWLIGPQPVLAQLDDEVIKFTKTQPRAWSDLSEKHQMQGTLVARNMVTKRIKLERADQSTIEVELDKLRDSDRNYVARQTAKLKRLEQRPKTKVDDTASDKNPFTETDSQKRLADSTKPQRSSGIDWHTDPIQAARVARGSEPTSDDRPIIWFRVLGDLEGYM